MPKISVIIPTHDRPVLLARAIDSVIAQTYKDYEILVIQNGIEAGTGRIVESYQDRGENIQYLFEKEADPSIARNAGIRNSKGEYIAFLDDDDEWLPNKLEKQVKMLDENSHLGFVSCRALMIGPKDGQVQLAPLGEFEDKMTDFIKAGNMIYSFSFVLIRRECFSNHGLLNPRYPVASDFELYLRLLRHYNFKTLEEPLAKYHVHAANLSRKKFVFISEQIPILKKLAPCPEKHVTRELINGRIQQLARRMYAEAVNAMDGKDYGNACLYYWHALNARPFIGATIQWGRFSNTFYKVLKPYAAILFCFIKALSMQKMIHRGVHNASIS